MIKVFILTLLLAFTSSTNAGKFNEQEIKCLSLNAYHEARSEGEKGMLATIFVVLNRTKDRRFPSTPCKVIAQPNQFSWYGKGKTIKEPEMYDKAKRLAQEVVDGKHKDVSRGALYFNSFHQRPRGTICTTRIGGHSFYKPVTPNK
ncbi:MAG: cell wall hydrolase [Erysipelotrichaceae bacterium]